MNATQSDTLPQRKERCALEMENQILGEELLKARAEHAGMRAMIFGLYVAVFFLGVTHTTKWVLWTVAIAFMVFAALMLIGGVCWAAKRGDEAMGIGDSQGR
ncbi:MAG: hypothetical protein J0M24_13960 [Verrucomicrobia bacterium]|nr:hypothetical protein [Verrucomicrobiota bacterium]